MLHSSTATQQHSWSIGLSQFKSQEQWRSKGQINLVTLHDTTDFVLGMTIAGSGTSSSTVAATIKGMMSSQPAAVGVIPPLPGVNFVGGSAVWIQPNTVENSFAVKLRLVLSDLFASLADCDTESSKAFAQDRIGLWVDFQCAIVVPLLKCLGAGPSVGVAVKEETSGGVVAPLWLLGRAVDGLRAIARLSFSWYCGSVNAPDFLSTLLRLADSIVEYDSPPSPSAGEKPKSSSTMVQPAVSRGVATYYSRSCMPTAFKTFFVELLSTNPKTFFAAFFSRLMESLHGTRKAQVSFTKRVLVLSSPTPTESSPRKQMSAPVPNFAQTPKERTPPSAVMLVVPALPKP